ncbi:hypothetical protein Tco_0680610 [Tanacetum coccineum]|uniref:Uncharacterized protein n=1 Tax=Tanacetum coccineum TaxID=301880 RepID=A0ABQ4XMF8_9ASTR
MRRLTKGYTGVEIRLFPTMLTSPTPSSSPTRITSSPSLSSAPSTEPTFEPQPSPDAEYHSLEDDLKITKKTSSAGHSLSLSYDVERRWSLKFKTWESKEGARVFFCFQVRREDYSSKQGSKRMKTLTHTFIKKMKLLNECFTYTAEKDTQNIVLLSKKLLEQERLGLEEAIRLQEQVDKEERAQIARDEEIARQLLALDKERVTTKTKTTKDIDWNDPSVQKYWDLKNKPKSEAQARKNMIVYLKNQSNYKMKDFEGMSYDRNKDIFERYGISIILVSMIWEDLTRKRRKPSDFKKLK